MLLSPVAKPEGNSIGASITIGQEIRCLPYAGFLLQNMLPVNAFQSFKLGLEIMLKSQVSKILVPETRAWISLLLKYHNMSLLIRELIVKITNW